MRLLGPETDAMLTATTAAIGMACLVQLPPHDCAGPYGCPQHASPVVVHAQGHGYWRPLFFQGHVRKLLFSDNVCPLGSCVPEGMDYYGMQMRRMTPEFAPKIQSAAPSSAGASNAAGASGSTAPPSGSAAPSGSTRPTDSGPATSGVSTTPLDPTADGISPLP